MKNNLLVSNEKYKIIYELSPEAIGILDNKGIILDMNKRVYDWLGYQPSEIIGQHILKVPYLTKKAKAIVIKNFLRRMLGKKIPPYEVDFIAKDGRKLVGRILATPIRDENKKIIGDVVMISDVTEFKKTEEALQESEKKCRFLFEAVPIGIGLADLEGHILSGNQSMAEITGYNLDELRTINLKNTYANSDDRQRLVRALKKDGQVRDWEVKLKRKDGRVYDALLNIDLVKIAGQEVLLSTARDITEQKNIDRAKTEFVSLASHQLRTPLSAINWYTEVLLNEELGKFSKRQKEYLKDIYQSNKRLIDLVNALLNVSRIELGTFAIKPEPTNLIEIANSVLDELGQQIRKKKLKVEKNYEKNMPLINLDQNLIRIIFQNLFSNAVKYIPEKGSLKFLIKKENPNLLIKVSDNGYGIPKEQQSQIFTKFFRADNIRKKELDGTGLGLYIVRAILEQSGGKVWFESKENQGTTFYVSIPLAGMEEKKRAKQLQLN